MFLNCYKNIKKTFFYIYAIVIVENIVERFYSLRCNEVNFHDVQRLTVTTSSSHQVSKLHVIMEYSFLFPMVQKFN